MKINESRWGGTHEEIVKESRQNKKNQVDDSHLEIKESCVKMKRIKCEIEGIR